MEAAVHPHTLARNVARGGHAEERHERRDFLRLPYTSGRCYGENAREALGILQHLPHPSIPDLRLPALPLSFDDERAVHRSPPPAVGQHTAEILAEAGYQPDEFAALAARGVITT